MQATCEIKEFPVATLKKRKINFKVNNILFDPIYLKYFNINMN